MTAAPHPEGDKTGEKNTEPRMVFTAKSVGLYDLQHNPAIKTQTKHLMSEDSILNVDTHGGQR